MKLKSVKTFAKSYLQKLNQQRTGRVPLYSVSIRDFILLHFMEIETHFRFEINRYFLYLTQLFK